MTVLLFIATLVAFLTIDFVLHRREYALKAATLPLRNPLPAQWNHFPKGFDLAKNHIWMRSDKNGLVTCGIDRFLAKAIGSLSEVHVPPAGCELGPDKKSIAMLQEGKVLRLAIPFPGEVVDLNQEAIESTDLVTKDPYGKGWLLRVKGGLEDIECFAVNQPAAWLKGQMEDAIAFLLSRRPEHQLVTLQDGGTMIDGSLKEFDSDVWREFNDRFASLRTDPAPANTERT